MSPTAATPAVELKIDSIRPSPHNPRRIDPKNPHLQQLADSIKSMGLISPVVVRAITDPKDHYQYELVAGERRWRATHMAGLATIAAIITPLDENAAIAITVTENLQREDLSVLEESAGVNSLTTIGWGTKEIAEKLGKDLGWVARRARIDRLHPDLKKEWLSDKSKMPRWSAASLERIAMLEPTSQITFMKEFGKHGFHNVSFESLDHAIAEHTRFLSGAPWKLDDEALDPKAGACLNCTKRASCTPGLFDDITDAGNKKLPKKDRCLDPDCWTRKAHAFADRLLPTFLEKHPAGVLFSTSAHDDKHTPPVLLVHRPNLKKQSHHTAVIQGLWIDGPLAGTVTYHFMGEYDQLYKYDVTTKRKKAKGEKPEKAPAPKSPTPKQAEKMLEDREEQLDARRASLMEQSVRDEIAKHENCFMHKDMTEPEAWQIIDLAFHVGCYGVDNVGNKNEVAVPKHKHLINTAQLAWPAMHRNLIKWLTSYQSHVALKAIDNTKHVAQLCRMKWAELEKAAAAALPEPKSWEKLREAKKKK